MTKRGQQMAKRLQFSLVFEWRLKNGRISAKCANGLRTDRVIRHDIVSAVNRTDRVIRHDIVSAVKPGQQKCTTGLGSLYGLSGSLQQSHLKMPWKQLSALWDIGIFFTVLGAWLPARWICEHLCTRRVSLRYRFGYRFGTGEHVEKRNSSKLCRQTWIKYINCISRYCKVSLFGSSPYRFPWFGALFKKKERLTRRLLQEEFSRFLSSKLGPFSATNQNLDAGPEKMQKPSDYETCW